MIKGRLEAKEMCLRYLWDVWRIGFMDALVLIKRSDNAWQITHADDDTNRELTEEVAPDYGAEVEWPHVWFRYKQ